MYTVQVLRKLEGSIFGGYGFAHKTTEQIWQIAKINLAKLENLTTTTHKTTTTTTTTRNKKIVIVVVKIKVHKQTRELSRKLQVGEK